MKLALVNGQWQMNETPWEMVNDFEPSVFANHPQIKEAKDMMYAMGAAYAAMSGSGSAVYGLFEHATEQAMKDLSAKCCKFENLFYTIQP
jgi:4-diphosphocytidyl-2C-methyl-D-erythritol kinase